jgi:hypothetical protein
VGAGVGQVETVVALAKVPNAPKVPNVPNEPKVPKMPNEPNVPKVPKAAADLAQQWIIEQLRFDRAEHHAALSELPDWEQVVTFAQAERLAELLLASRAAEAFPLAVREQLEQIRLGTLARNGWLIKQLEEWLERFDAANIPTIVLKGAAMIALVYQRPALRPMSDLDVLVRRADFERAGELLRAAGFSPHDEDTENQTPTIRTQVAWVQETPPSFGIELHWHLIDSGYYARHVPIEWFWNRTMEMPLRARRARVLAPEAQLLHLASHIELHHAGAGVWWLYDIAALIHKFGAALDWDLVIDTAERFEWGQSLRVAIEQAQATFGVAIPEPVSARLTTLRATRHERIARTLAEPTAHLAAFLFDGWEQESWRARARYLWRSLFPPAEFMRARAPIRNRRDLVWQYLLRLGRGLYRVPRALWAGAAQMKRWSAEQKFRY